MREQITSFVVALQFLTICPPFLRRSFTPAELGRCVGYFPVVGVAMGLLLALSSRLLASIFPPGVSAALLLLVWVIVTGSLHVDGLLDACDGLFGGFTPEDRLRIMRDERIGGFALTGGVVLFLIKYSSLAALAGHAPALLLAPVFGRWAMAAGIVGFPYARAQGLGRDMKDNARRGQLVLATLSAALMALAAGQYVGLFAFGIAVLVTWLLARFVLQRIAGLTGDVYGALCEIIEAVTLLVFVASLTI